MAVFVLGRNGKALMPCSEKRARLLLARGRARVHRVVPFVIRLVDRDATSSQFQPMRIKLDPGSKATGVALVRDTEHVDRATGEILRGAAVLNLFELMHRGRQISEALIARRSMRRRRRGNLRYRAPRFLNRTRPAGWLAPSLQHRVDTTLAWVRRLTRCAPVTALSSELVRFDMQALENPEVSGVEYQQGTLFACRPCNQAKGTQPVAVFLAKTPKRLATILAQAKRPLKDAAAVNATRWALANALRATGLPVELASGGRTKFNRTTLGVPKAHALDAVCVGTLEAVTGWQKPTRAVKCTGRGSYQRTRLDKYGFPRGYLTRKKRVHGFQTGDLVRAEVPTGKKAGSHVGRVAVRAIGNFNIQRDGDVVQGIAHRHCRLIQRSDGYGYTRIASQKGAAGDGRAAHGALSLPGLKAEVSRAFG